MPLDVFFFFFPFHLLRIHNAGIGASGGLSTLATLSFLLFEF